MSGGSFLVSSFGEVVSETRIGDNDSCKSIVQVLTNSLDFTTNKATLFTGGLSLMAHVDDLGRGQVKTKPI